MEEQEVEPSEVFVDLGMLIVEGRVPGLTERGYGEGPHCPSTHPGPHAKHECDPQVAQVSNQDYSWNPSLLDDVGRPCRTSHPSRTISFSGLC